jgi:hypothetical protein
MNSSREEEDSGYYILLVKEDGLPSIPVLQDDTPAVLSDGISYQSRSKVSQEQKDWRRTEETGEEDTEPTMGDKSLTCKTGHGRRRRDEEEKEARREWRRIKKD